MRYIVDKLAVFFLLYIPLPLALTHFHKIIDEDTGSKFFKQKRYQSFNLGQKFGEKFTKLSKLSFSMEFFTADFLQFLTEKRQSLAFMWTAR